MKMYCVLLSVIFLMSLVTMVVSVGSSTRYYENGTSVTCLGIVCPLDEIFVPCTHSLGDGKHDTCEPCPSDRPRTLSAFDSSVFEDPPVYFVCKSVLERCECAEEAELVNPLNCTKTLEPVCKCNTTAGYYGQDPNACQLSENKQCKLPGYELKQDGSCDECPGGTYKNTHQFGRCLLQPRCQRPLVVDNPGDSAHRRTCKIPVTTPPDKIVTTRESTSAADIEYSTLSYSTFNVTASTNQTSPLIDSTNFEWINFLGAVVVSVPLCVCCVIIKKKRKRKKLRQRHQNNEDGVNLIAKGMTQSLNRYQQGNGGNTHTSSCWIDKLKTKICPKTCRNSKAYEHVKTKTMNEEKTTMIGNKTSNIVYVDEIKGKVNSNDITVKENSNDIADNVDVNGTFLNMNGDKTTDKVNDDKTTEGMNGEKTAAKVNGDKTTEGMKGEETTAKVNDDKTTERRNDEETAAKVNDDKTTERMNDEETAAKVNDDKTTERRNDEETAATVNDDKTTERRNDEETAAKVNDDKTTERRNDEETAATVNDDKTTERRNDEETAAKVNDDKTTERRNDEETAAKVNDDKTTERRNDEETAAKVNDDKTTERRNDEETAAKVNDDKTTERRNDEETAAKVNDDKTTERRNDEETAAKVNDDKTTEIENCENTTTTSDANENHDTSNSSLDVNSFFSSGKTSSGFVDDMHILKWSQGSSKGFIECTDTSGKRFKSIAIHNGSQGMILLKMKDIGKGYKFIFVSSSENSKIESYVEVGVEPVTNNFDLNTLLKSGLSTLDFSSSEFVQNRPEEDLSSHRLQKGSLDQPNHMSLQHSQNQADSGISDTTPAECSNQAGDSLPHLNVSSLDQDVDNDEN